MENSAGIPNPIVGDRYQSIFQDSRGHLWVGGANVFGLTDFDPVTQTAATYFQDNSDPNGFHGRGVFDTVESKSQAIWIAAQTVIDRLDRTTDTFTTYDFQGDERQLKSLLYDSNGDLWAGGSAGLYKYNLASDKFDLISNPKGIVDILEANDGLIWLATHSGLYRFDPQTQQIVGSDEPYPGVADSLSSENLNVLYQSRSGLIWIGGDNGIDIYDPLTARFAYYRHIIPGAPYSLAAGQLASIDVADATTAWIGVDSVLHKVNLTSGDITFYPLEDYGFGTDPISAILQDHAGIVWLGASRRRLLQFDPRTETLDEYPSLFRTP